MEPNYIRARDGLFACALRAPHVARIGTCASRRHVAGTDSKNLQLTSARAPSFAAAVRTECGMSMLELILSLSLAGILLTASTPSFSGLHHRLLLNGEVEKLRSFVERNRAIAEVTGRERIIRFYPASRLAEASFTDSDGLTEARVVERERLQLASSLTMQSAQFGQLADRRMPAALDCRPDGSASPGRIVITSPSRCCELVQSLRGPLRTICH